MKTFTLNNGLKFPALGFGTYKASLEHITFAIEAGYRYFDTASFYNTEILLAQAISQSGFSRDDFIIASKLWKDDMGFDKTISAFQQILDNLRTDYLDAFFIHWPRPNLELKDWKSLGLETWRALEELYSQGKIRALGLSNFLPHHAQNIIDTCKVYPAIAQLEFHPGYTQTFALNYYREKKILLQAWSPNARGRVFNDELILELAGKYNASPAQICISFCLRENVMPITKASTLERNLENLRSLHIELEPEDIMRLENMPPVGWGGEHPDRKRVHV